MKFILIHQINGEWLTEFANNGTEWNTILLKAKPGDYIIRVARDNEVVVHLKTNEHHSKYCSIVDDVFPAPVRAFFAISGLTDFYG